MNAGDGSFPPATICVCTCRGDEHTTVWVDFGTFAGTRCRKHGGHKFQPTPAAGPAEEATQ